jgi:2-dehydro-3-deoxyphosphogluconate aldolase/(4S)-4-hydroxy-2-oxoglutarate aldolase
MTESDAWFDESFGATRAMVILRGLGAERSLEIANSVWEAGVRLLELPVQSEADLEALRVVAAAGAVRGVPVGAGTVVDPEKVAAVAAAGAVFTVSPGVDIDVIAASLDAGLPTLPGVGSGTDVQLVRRRFGLHWMKAFPARQLGAGWMAAMHGPYPDVRFVATGGVTPDDAADYLRNGARVVALGSSVTAPGALDALRAITGSAREEAAAPH